MALFLCPFSWSWQSHTFQQLIALKKSQPAELPSCNSCLASSVGQPCATEPMETKTKCQNVAMLGELQDLLLQWGGFWWCLKG